MKSIESWLMTADWRVYLNDPIIRVVSSRSASLHPDCIISLKIYSDWSNAQIWKYFHFSRIVNQIRDIENIRWPLLQLVMSNIESNFDDRDILTPSPHSRDIDPATDSLKYPKIQTDTTVTDNSKSKKRPKFHNILLRGEIIKGITPNMKTFFIIFSITAFTKCDIRTSFTYFLREMENNQKTWFWWIWWSVSCQRDWQWWTCRHQGRVDKTTQTGTWVKCEKLSRQKSGAIIKWKVIASKNHWKWPDNVEFVKYDLGAKNRSCCAKGTSKVAACVLIL